MKPLIIPTIALTLSLGLIGAADAALVHQFDAASTGNTSSQFNGSEGRWNDELTTEQFRLINTINLGPTVSPGTSFTTAYSTDDNQNTGRGGVGIENNSISDQNAFGEGFDEIMVEVWLRADLDSLTTGGDEELVFESGGGARGFSITLRENGGNAQARLHFAGDSSQVITIGLNPIDDSDFFQLTAIIDEDGSGDFIKLMARDTMGTVSMNTGAAGAIEIGGSVSGSNASGVFAAGNGNNTSTSLTTGGAGGPLDGDDVAGFNGAIALINIYDMVDESAIAASYDAITATVPAPAALPAGLALIGLIAARRRR